MNQTGARLPAIDRPINPQLIARFRAGLDLLWQGEGPLGVAVSGGPDSVALLLLAKAALPGRVFAATVDHGLRPESAAEASFVASLCAGIGVPHATLEVQLSPGNIQDAARTARYAALADWACDNGLSAIATAHHADDQAETLVMRLNRGSGLSGLAGVRATNNLPGAANVALVRPLLDWRKAELVDLAQSAGITPVDDPSNRDDRFDRARIRAALAEAPWLDMAALAKSAGLLGEAEEAIVELAQMEWSRCVTISGDHGRYRPEGPAIIRKRVVAKIIAQLAIAQPRGGQVAVLVSKLERGEGGNLAGILAKPRDGEWAFAPEPRRNPAG